MINEINFIINDINKEKNSISIKVNDFNNNIRDAYEEKDKIIKNIEIKLYNDILKKEIELKKNAHKNLEFDKNKIISNLSELSKNLGIISALLEQSKKQLEELNDAKHRFRVYELYEKATSKDGVATMYLSKKINQINDEIKKVLFGIVDFDIVFEFDEISKNVFLFMNKDNVKQPIELSGGMEKFISSLAIRVSLINISTLPKSDLFIVDEGFGTLDKDNIKKCKNMLRLISEHFRNVLVVSHIDDIKDYVDNVVEIIKTEDGYARIA